VPLQSIEAIGKERTVPAQFATELPVYSDQNPGPDCVEDYSRRTPKMPNRTVTLVYEVMLTLAMAGLPWLRIMPSCASGLRCSTTASSRRWGRAKRPSNSWCSSSPQHISSFSISIHRKSIDQVLARLTRDLELAPEQQQQIRPLLDEHQNGIQAQLDKIPNASRQELGLPIHAVSEETPPVERRVRKREIEVPACAAACDSNSSRAGGWYAVRSETGMGRTGWKQTLPRRRSGFV
jgi:hypothetical protein